MADELVRFKKGIWDVCWVDTGSKDDLGPFLDSLPAGARRAIVAHITNIAILPNGPMGQVKQVEGQPGLFEIKERYNNCHYRVFCFATANKKHRRLYILGNCYEKKSKRIPPDVLRRAVDIKSRAEYLDPPP